MAATLRVVSWNIRAAIGPGPFPDRWWRRIDADRLRAIGEFVAGLDVDLVALQEVALASRDGDLVDNAGDLARQLGYDVRYGAVRTYDVTEDGACRGVGMYGNALLCRQPLQNARTVALPQADAASFVEPAGADHPAAGVTYAEAPGHIREPRSLLLADVDGGWRVGTAHFSHVGSGERLLQARATVAAFAGATPAALLGDLNASIGSPELAPFRSWTDGFGEPSGAPERVSTDDGWPIDHVLVRGATVGTCRVVRASGDLSDHYPVVAELTAGAPG